VDDADIGTRRTGGRLEEGEEEVREEEVAGVAVVVSGVGKGGGRGRGRSLAGDDVFPAVSSSGLGDVPVHRGQVDSWLSGVMARGMRSVELTEDVDLYL
jgi:hypothetical protein